MITGYDVEQAKSWIERQLNTDRSTRGALAKLELRQMEGRMSGPLVEMFDPPKGKLAGDKLVAFVSELAFLIGQTAQLHANGSGPGFHQYAIVAYFEKIMGEAGQIRFALASQSGSESLVAGRNGSVGHYGGPGGGYPGPGGDGMGMGFPDEGMTRNPVAAMAQMFGDAFALNTRHAEVMLEHLLREREISLGALREENIRLQQANERLMRERDEVCREREQLLSKRHKYDLEMTVTKAEQTRKDETYKRFLGLVPVLLHKVLGHLGGDSGGGARPSGPATDAVIASIDSMVRALREGLNKEQIEAIAELLDMEQRKSFFAVLEAYSEPEGKTEDGKRAVILFGTLVGTLTIEQQSQILVVLDTTQQIQLHEIVEAYRDLEKKAQAANGAGKSSH
jgi:hypothetical protein